VAGDGGSVDLDLNDGGVAVHVETHAVHDPPAHEARANGDPVVFGLEDALHRRPGWSTSERRGQHRFA